MTKPMWSLVGAMCAVVLSSAGCRPVVRIEPSPFDEDDPRALPASALQDQTREPDPDPVQDELATGPAVVKEVPAARQVVRRTVLDRAALHAVLDRGPGSFLRGVELAAHFRDGRFNGWRIVQFMPGEARFDGYDLAPGDIIGAVNGRLIERPPHLAALWDELRASSAIVVVVQRGGKRFELRVDITGDEIANELPASSQMRPEQPAPEQTVQKKGPSRRPF